MSNSLHSEIVEAEGHLVDSQLLNAIFDRVIERGGEFEVLEFDIGRDNEAISKLTLKVSAETQHGLTELLEALMPLGCYSQPDRSATLREAEQPGCVPDDFYSTTNHRTEVKLGAEWVAVEEQRMDAVIIVEGTEARCRKLRDVIAGDKIVCGVDGVRVSPEFQERDRLGFAFMMNDVSSSPFNNKERDKVSN